MDYGDGGRRQIRVILGWAGQMTTFLFGSGFPLPFLFLSSNYLYHPFTTQESQSY